MKRMTDQLPAGWLFILLAAIISWMILFGCIPSRERCQSLYPPQESTNDSNWTTYEPDSLSQNADSSWSEYLVECQQTATGLRAVIVRLMGQGAGEVIQPPTAVIDSSGKLITKAVKPETIIRYKVKLIHSKRVSSLVYVKYTNIKTGFEWFQIWLCRILVMAGILAAAFFSIKNKWYMIIINLGISLVNKFKKKN